MLEKNVVQILKVFFFILFFSLLEGDVFFLKNKKKIPVLIVTLCKKFAEVREEENKETERE